MIILLWLMLFAGTANAASLPEPPSLAWDYAVGGTLPATATVQRSTTATGTFTSVAVIPSLPSTWKLPATADNLWYRISNAGGVSNVVQYTPTVQPPITPTIDLLTPRVDALTVRVTAVEAALAALAVPPPVEGPLTSRMIDATHIELTCVGSSMKTTGSGLKRVVECLP